MSHLYSPQFYICYKSIFISSLSVQCSILTNWKCLKCVDPIQFSGLMTTFLYQNFPTFLVSFFFFFLENLMTFPSVSVDESVNHIGTLFVSVYCLSSDNKKLSEIELITVPGT